MQLALGGKPVQNQVAPNYGEEPRRKRAFPVFQSDSIIFLNSLDIEQMTLISCLSFALNLGVIQAH